MHRCPLSVVVASVALFAAGCREEAPRAYRVPKDSNGDTAATSASKPASATKPPWVVPDGWAEKPASGGMRVASYGVTAPDGRAADISVVALGGTAGGTLENVNRWRNQIGLDPITEADLGKFSQVVPIGDREAAMFELAGDKPTLDGKYKARTLAAVLPAGEMTVFFKISGEDALVAENKSKFLSWIKSVNTGGGEEASSGAAPASASASTAPPPSVSGAAESAGLPRWTVPANWTPGGERPMRLATFAVSGPGGASADMSISTLAAAGGGTLANVNRWRGQLGLPAWTDADLETNSKRVEVDGNPGVVVDFAGDKSVQGEARKTRILGAIVPRGGQTWFYKLTGDDALVAGERENFMGFVKSVKH